MFEENNLNKKQATKIKKKKKKKKQKTKKKEKAQVWLEKRRLISEYCRCKRNEAPKYCRTTYR
jgi:hypothetical protein